MFGKSLVKRYATKNPECVQQVSIALVQNNITSIITVNTSNVANMDQDVAHARQHE